MIMRHIFVKSPAIQGCSLYLVLGANGQVGRAFCAHLASLKDTAFIAITSADLDYADAEFTKKFQKLLDKTTPDIVVNFAAYTKVEQAEKEPDIAMQVNARAPEAIAKMLNERGIALIHTSTDYVFSGSKQSAYTETDSVSPLNIYGRSKLAGEQAVLAAHAGAYILRYSWVYDAYGSNFLTTMAGLMQQQTALRIVANQVGAPSFADDLAVATATFAAKIHTNKSPNPSIYHVCAQGHTSWHGFATHIAQQLRVHGLPCVTGKIEPILANEFSSKIKRPENSRLSTKKLEKLGIVLPHWQDGLARAVMQMSYQKQEASCE